MNIGEMMLNIGIKGADKTVGALTNVKKGLGDVGSMSLEAKAGIIAAMYALERLFATSGKAGTDLTNFNAVTGESIKTLQQYQYAARQVGVSNQEVEGSFKGLQGAMAQVAAGTGAAPAGLARVAQMTGNISQKDIENFAKKPELLIQRLQEYAKKETNIPLRGQTLKSFGLSDGMVAALSRQAFRPEVMKNAPTYSDKEVGQLDKANIAWSNLGNTIQMSVGHFNAAHGGQLVKEITVVVSQLIKFVELITRISEKLKVFSALASVFGVINKGLGAISGYGEKASGDKKGLIHGAVMNAPSLLKGAGDALAPMMKSIMSAAGGVPSGIMSVVDEFREKPKGLPGHKAVLPSIARSSGNGGNTQNNNVNITNTFQHPGTDHKKTGDSINSAVQKAFRQIPAQAHRN